MIDFQHVCADEDRADSEVDELEVAEDLTDALSGQCPFDVLLTTYTVFEREGGNYRWEQTDCCCRVSVNVNGMHTYPQQMFATLCMAQLSTNAVLLVSPQRCGLDVAYLLIDIYNARVVKRALFLVATVWTERSCRNGAGLRCCWMRHMP